MKNVNFEAIYPKHHKRVQRHPDRPTNSCTIYIPTRHGEEEKTKETVASQPRERERERAKMREEEHKKRTSKTGFSAPLHNTPSASP